MDWRSRQDDGASHGDARGNRLITRVMAGFRPLGTADDVAGFTFKQRHGKVNWRQVEDLDLNHVLQTGDVDAVHAVLENLTYALLEREDLTRLSDAKAVQLFKLFQLCLEYLLNVQNSLYSQFQQVQSQHSDVKVQTAALEGKVRTQEKEINTRTQELASKRKALVSYEYLLRQPSTSAAAAQALTRANAVKCSTCGKLFLSREYLDKHELRRHAVKKEPEPPKQDQAFGAMLDTMKVILSQNLAVVSEAHAREIDAMKTAFERKLQDLESVRLSLEAHRSELEAPQANSVNDLVLRELINTQNEMRRVLEERDHLVMEQMKQAEEQRRRQEELEKERQVALEHRLTQLVQTQLLAHLPTERSPPQVLPPEPVQPAKEAPRPPEPLPAEPLRPTQLQLSVQRQPISSQAGDVEEDEPSPRDIAAALGPEVKVIDSEEVLQVNQRREGIAAGLTDSINSRDTVLEVKDEEDELSTAALQLGVDLGKEPDLAFVVRAYVVHLRKRLGSERLVGVYKEKLARLRQQSTQSVCKAFLREQENERPVGDFSKFTAFFKHNALDLKRAKDSIRAQPPVVPREPTSVEVPIVSSLHDLVERLLPAFPLQAVPSKPAVQPEPSKPVAVLPPPEVRPRVEPKKPILAPQLLSHLLKDTQGFTEKLDFATMLDPIDQISPSLIHAEGSVLAFGRIGRNGIEEMSEEVRKQRVTFTQNQSIARKVLQTGLFHRSPAD